MAANFDGTVWHASQNSAYRYISGSVAPDTPPAPPQLLNGPAGVQRVASTGFGQGGVLCQQNNATQLYVYDSPYLFKTGEQYDVSQWGVLETGLGNLYFISSDANGHNTLVALNAQTGQP